MRKRFTAISVISSVVLVFALVVMSVGIDQATAPVDQNRDVTLKAPGSDFFFFGCWSYFPSGRFCHDIYQDSQGNNWICDKCRETKKPGPKTCRIITEEELARGWWCL